MAASRKKFAALEGQPDGVSTWSRRGVSVCTVGTQRRAMHQKLRLCLNVVIRLQFVQIHGHLWSIINSLQRYKACALLPDMEPVAYDHQNITKPARADT